MKEWNVCMVSAFGRGETLAMALQENGFDVHVLDFTSAFPIECRKGVGPFPIAIQQHVPAHAALLEEVKPLPRGLTLWLPGGPIELSGSMAPHYAATHPAVKQLLNGQKSSDFQSDWLRRFVKQWTSPVHHENWSMEGGGSFPFAGSLGLIPASKDEFVFSFSHFQALDYKYSAAKTLEDVRLESHRINSVEVAGDSRLAVTSPQWIWCLSSEETERLGPKAAKVMFPYGVRRSEWVWMAFEGACERGPWSDGFPELVIAIGDPHLPWVYGNLCVLRWLESDRFMLWMKVPAGASLQPKRWQEWVREAVQMLNARFALPKWTVNPERWSLCPHSAVFEASDWTQPNYRNWDWIAPETLERLDLAARLEREAASFHRLIQWRNDQIKKQGAGQRDQPLHPS